MTGAADWVVVGAVVALRLALPLSIFRHPLPGLLVALAVDALDQTAFQVGTSIELDGYQSYDKALDVYYLSLAYVSTLRNWAPGAAFEIGRFLFYFRLVGVAAFEVTGGEAYLLLVVFPNTFEFFFIFYELVRTRWDPARRSAGFWFAAAAGIWVAIKLPQEYWLHVLKLDTTDLAVDHPVAAAAVAVGVAALIAVAWWAARPRLAPADHPTTLRADPLPESMDEARERLAYRARRGTVLDVQLLEKVVLVAVICVIFVQIVPGTDPRVAAMALLVTGLVVANGLIGLWTARLGRGIDSVAAAFSATAALNAALVLAARGLWGVERDGPVALTVFCVLLLSLTVTIYDRYRPVLDARRADPPGLGGVAA